MVKPTHAVFVDNVAQIKLVTSDSDVFDTVMLYPELAPSLVIPIMAQRKLAPKLVR